MARFIAPRWDSTVRDCSLETVIGLLYRFEINCGMQSFYDGGWTFWIGDDMNGRKAEASFDRDQLHTVAAWLADNAERLYPALRAAA